MGNAEWDDREDLGENDDEFTRLTKQVHRRFKVIAEEQLGDEVGEYEYAESGAMLRFRLPYPGGEYVVNVMGQSSVTGRGQQGMTPEEMVRLRDIPEPVLLVFCDGADGNVWSGWLHFQDAHAISRDPAHPRAGMWVRELERCRVSEFIYPSDVPAEDPRRLFTAT